MITGSRNGSPGYAWQDTTSRPRSRPSKAAAAAGPGVHLFVFAGGAVERRVVAERAGDQGRAGDCG
jgi:hypothetical protein